MREGERSEGGKEEGMEKGGGGGRKGGGGREVGRMEKIG